MNKPKVWVGMKAVDKVVGGPPCKKDGVDCTDRYPGCSGHCERFAAWKDRRMNERKAYFEENGADLEMEKYAMQSYQNMQRLKGEKVKER